MIKLSTFVRLLKAKAFLSKSWFSEIFNLSHKNLNSVSFGVKNLLFPTKLHLYLQPVQDHKQF